MKNTISKTKFKYKDTVGFTADVGGRGFHLPRDLAINSEEKVFVVNRSGAIHTLGLRVSIMDVNHNYYGEFSKFGKNPGELYWPSSITFDTKDNVYITDEYTHSISVFEKDGNFLERWGKKGNKQGEVNSPSGIVCDQNNELFIVDIHNDRIQVMTTSGKFLREWGKKGNQDGEFNKPWGIALGNNNEILVADWRNDRIQIFDKNGLFIDKFGRSGTDDGELSRPSGVCVDKDGFFYVADWGNQRVQIFDEKFNFIGKLRGQAKLSKWAKEYLNANPDEKRARESFSPVINIDNVEPHEESARIESYFWDPTSVVIDKNGHLLVLDSNRNRIQIYQKV